MGKIKLNNKGAALIIAILMMSIIVVMTLYFNKSMKTELYSAVNAKDSIMLGYIAKSGYNFALAILQEDDENIDSLNDSWAMIKAYSSLSEKLFNEGRFLVDITDLSGKIQINSLVKQDGAYNIKQKAILIRLLTSDTFNMEEEAAIEILNNIKDWIDRDEESTGFGSENTYYESLDTPYSCRNGPLKSIGEMASIKGISEGLLFGTTDNPGLVHFITVYGDGSGKININTAGREIIMALSDNLDNEMVDDILDYRMDEDNDLGDTLWFKDALGTEENVIDPLIITVKSSFFEIKSIGSRASSTKELRIVIKRNYNNFLTLSWEII